MPPRIGVLFFDGSIMLMSMSADPDGAEAEARDMIDGSNMRETDPRKMAKLVSVDVNPEDIVVIE